MRRVSAVIVGISILAGAASAADTEHSSYARIAVLRPHDGDTVDFEAGYIRHLDWHRQAGDKWVWYGWNITYEFLPELSRGTGVPQPTARLELTTVDLLAGSAEAFEEALRPAQPALTREALWYRMVAGGTAPRYVRLRPHASLATMIDASDEQALPEKVHGLIAQTTVEILTLRPTMSYGLVPVRP